MGDSLPAFVRKATTLVAHCILDGSAVMGLTEDGSAEWQRCCLHGTVTFKEEDVDG